MRLAAVSDFTATPIWSMVNIKNLHLKCRPKRRACAAVCTRKDARRSTKSASVSCQLAHDLFYQFVGIAPVRRDFRGISRDGAVSQMLAGTLEQRLAQHF